MLEEQKKLTNNFIDENTKLEVATEILMEQISDTTRVIERAEKGETKRNKISFTIVEEVLKNRVNRFLKQRDEIYSGDFNAIDDIINSYKVKEEKTKEQVETPIEDYYLSEKELNIIYERIFEIFTKDKESVKNPSAIINLGAPGSGKTGLNGFSLNKFKGKNAVIINGDEIRKFHPKYKEIISKYPNDYAKITGKASDYWTRRLIDDCTKNNYNLIFEGTGRSLEILNTIKNQMKNHKVTVRVLAVSKADCLMSILKRYKLLKDTVGTGRLIEIEKFNSTFDNLVPNIGIIEDSGIEVEVYKRGSKPEKPIKIYSTKKAIDQDAMDIINEVREKDEQNNRKNKKLLEEFTNIVKSLTDEEKRAARDIILELYKELNKLTKEKHV